MNSSYFPKDSRSLKFFSVAVICSAHLQFAHQKCWKFELESVSARQASTSPVSAGTGSIGAIGAESAESDIRDGD